MNPFFNQIHGRGAPSNPPLQQAMPFNPSPFPHLPIPCPSPAFPNPQNPQPVNMAAQFGAMQQNMHSALQNQQVLALVQQNLNQIVGLLNGQIFPPNPALVPPFNSGIVGNHQGGLGVCGSSFGAGSAGGVLQGKNHEMQSFSAVHSGGRSGMREFSGASRVSGSPVSRSPMNGQHGRGRMMHQNSGHYQPQVHSLKGGEIGVSNIESSSNNNFTKSFHRSGEREASQMRFQKSQIHHGKPAKGCIRPFAKNGRPGQQNWKERDHQFNKGSKQAPVERKRPIPVNYTENEIKAWREARKKNFPTNGNIAKKLAGNVKNLEDSDGDAKLRRQQLKEILAQQAQLGVEVAEIPSSYLFDSENLISNSKDDRKDFRHGRKSWNARGRLQRNDNKRQNKHNQDKTYSKRPKLANDDTSDNLTKKREPTLLQKLLSKEIKKDKSKLLQVFRFMVMNSFFEHWPHKPLEFPAITMKDSDSETLAAVETGTLLIGLESTPASGENKEERTDELDAAAAVGDVECGPIDDFESDGDNDGSGSFSEGEDDQNLHGKLEEGEITE